MSNEPDSRDPEPVHRVLKRIAHEAHQLRQRQEQRTRERTLVALRGGHGVDRNDAGEDLALLAMLVAELADMLQTIKQSER